MNPYENIKEGAFTKQFKNRKPEYHHIKTLKDWSHFILKNPNLFNKISQKRSLFYKNLIEKSNKSPLTGGQIKKCRNIYNKKYGGKISAKEFELMLKESYKKPNERQPIGDYIIDPSLSTDENIVYYNPKTKEVKNVYRGTEGTLKDWGNNMLYTMGLHKYSGRYKRANDIQKKVEEKYGTDNLDVLAHSQSGAFTQELGKNAKNVVVLNPATHPLYTPKSKNSTIVRSSGDLVSNMHKLNPLNYFKKSDVTIKAKTNNPITEHMPTVLEGLDPNMILGNGRRKMHKSLKLLLK